MISRFPLVLADVISLEFIVISGGILLLVIAGSFIAVAMVIAGFIKRRKAQRELESSSTDHGS